MSEPRRLLDGGGNDLERSLLRSARGDSPSDGSRRKTLIALGLAGGVGGAAATTTATSTATSTAAVAIKGSAAMGGAALIEWIGVGVITGFAVIGAASMIAPKRAAAPISPAHPQGVPNPGPAQSALVAPGPANPPPSSPPEAAPPPAPLPTEEPAPVEVPKSAAPPPIAQPAATSLTYEVAALNRAREALAAGDAAGTLRALDNHNRRFPGGMLGPEATVLRIEALALRGDRASAVRLGKAFLDAHPRSPHANRLRSLLGIDPPSPPAHP